ncbi:MAG TPA: carboxypeptidase-like regulatory domain-containing protein, partial [Chitinophagaceae bacterium]
MLKRLTILLIAISASFCSFSQVTTSSMNGTVKDNSGQPLTGATVTAIHLPSGTKYSTLSKEGVFNLQGLRIGGPYEVKIDYVGLKSATFDGINLQLGEPYSITAQLSVSEQVLENVVIATKSRKTSADKFGASTIINNRQLTTLPTISRSITDFTRLTPQANPAQNSYGGRDGRYNNVTIDGANLNNNFGLSTDPLPGGGANPISLDAIEEVSVNIAPYDVRQAQFTGANIAAVTKSGTNTFHGTAYGYYRNQHMIGRNVGDVTLPPLQKSY